MSSVENIYSYQHFKKATTSIIEDFNDGIAMNVLIWEYKKNAKNKNLEFNISKNYFHTITKKNCEYCGSSPSSVRFTPNRKRRYTFNGIDRKDNSKGYINKNCIPCCKVCNYMKKNHTQEDFLTHIDKVFAKHLNL